MVDNHVKLSSVVGSIGIDPFDDERVAVGAIAILKCRDGKNRVRWVVLRTPEINLTEEFREFSLHAELVRRRAVQIWDIPQSS